MRCETESRGESKHARDDTLGETVVSQVFFESDSVVDMSDRFP